MFNKEKLEFYLNRCLSTGADFSELFIEKKKDVLYKLSSEKVDKVKCLFDYGMGIRIIKDDNVLYGSINNMEEESIINLIDSLTSNLHGEKNDFNINLSELKEETITNNHMITDKEKIDLLHKIDKETRQKDKRVIQVENQIIESFSEIIIVNSNNLHLKKYKRNIRILSQVFVKENDITKSQTFTIATTGDYKILDKINLEDKINKNVDTAIKKLSSKDFKGGMMPVVLNSGFGGVIMHEAVGHSLESASVKDKTSIVSDKQNKKIASSVVTLIDDATIKDEWGSYYYDDEGNISEKKILIENGILKNYMVDNFGSLKMKQKSNGCCRRESYQYIPTSRMSNTFIQNGESTKEEMIKSIDFGLYAESLGGGSVDPNTGNFNFSVKMGYVIEKGKLTDIVENVTLIGNSLDILKNIEMVGNDLLLSDGICGASSGSVPVTVGQPTIKVSNILVGGSINE